MFTFVCSALYWAAYGGHVAVFDRLVSSKFTDLNLQNKLGDTALLAAALKGHSEIVSALIKKGAKIELKNGNGDTALSVATSPQGTV